MIRSSPHNLINCLVSMYYKKLTNGRGTCCLSFCSTIGHVLQVSLQLYVPLVHPIDLMFILLLAGTLRQISLSPFPIASSQLLDTYGWVITVIALNWIFISAFTGWVRATMRELIFVIETAPLITTFEVSYHTSTISFEFVNPSLLRRKTIEPLS